MHLLVMIINQKVDLFYKNIFFGDLASKKSKIKENSLGNIYTEIWVLRILELVRGSLREYFQSCSKRCGYIYLILIFFMYYLSIFIFISKQIYAKLNTNIYQLITF